MYWYTLLDSLTDAMLLTVQACHFKSEMLLFYSSCNTISTYLSLIIHFSCVRTLLAFPINPLFVSNYMNDECMNLTYLK